MTDMSQPGAESAPEAPTVAVTAPSDTPEKLSTTQAARLLASLRKPKQQQQEAPERAPMAAPEPEPEESTAQADDAAPPEAEAPGETQEADPTPPEPTIEPPRSWTKEARERWQTLPRETQEYLAEREQERERELRRGQNEAAEARKAIEAERQRAEQVRQQYEAALPQLLQTLHAQQAGEFADVQSVADVERLAREDWPRYLQWDLAQKKLQAVQQEMASAQMRAAQEQQQQFAAFAREQDRLLAERVPDMADPDKAPKLQSAALALLKDTGFKDEELAKAWQTRGDFSLRDARVQSLIVDAVRWREAQAKAREAVKKPVPPVQRPGVSQGKDAARQQELQNLEKQIGRSSGINALRAAARLVATRRAGR